MLAAFGPHEQTVTRAQASSFAEIDFAAVVQARHHIHALCWQAGQRGVFAEGAISQQDVPLFELLPQLAEQTQVMMAQAAQDDVEDSPRCSRRTAPPIS